MEECGRRFADRPDVGKSFGLPQQQTLALNAKHLIVYLEGSEDEELDEMICRQVADLAEMARSPLRASAWWPS